MKKYTLLFSIVFYAIAMVACGSNDSNIQDNTTPAAGTHSAISGNAVKGPIEGAEIKLSYFAADGTETEIAAGNAPVLTNAAGGFEFHVDPQSLDNIQPPWVLKSEGGTMGGEPAPELGAVISDITDLQADGRIMNRHLSTASSVAARMLTDRALADQVPPSAADAAACISKVENTLKVNLKHDPVDAAQGVAMVNNSVDQNLDLFNTPENNAAVEEYIDYLAKNLNSSSGALDGEMEDPDHPGQDKPAGFDGLGDGHLASICPNGPVDFHHLMVEVDKTSIVNDGTDSVTILLTLRDGMGRSGNNDAEVKLDIKDAQGEIEEHTVREFTNGTAQLRTNTTVAGQLEIQATHTLANGNIISCEVVVEVIDTQENLIPIAQAGSDQNVSTGSVVSLNGSQSSDPNNDPLTYAWTLTSIPAGSGATLSDKTIFNPTFTADADGEYVAELVVNDGTIDSLPATVTITAASDSQNSPPTAHAGQNQNVKTGSEVTLDGSGSNDADNDPLTYTWTMNSKPTGSNASLSSTDQVGPSFTADVEGTYEIELVVHDGTVASTAATVTITASAANSVPIAYAGPDQNVTANEQVGIDGKGSSDADNDPLTYLWTIISKPSGSTVSLPATANSEMVFFTPDMPGDYVIQLVVNDGTVDSPADTVTITAADASPDGAALFLNNCSGLSCHGSDGSQGVNIKGASSKSIENKLAPSHKGVTIDDIGNSEGANALADFLNQ